MQLDDIRGKLSLTLSADAIESIFRNYHRLWKSIPGAPDPTCDISDKDIEAIPLITECKTDWATFCNLRQTERERENDHIDPFLPIWFEKTDRGGNQWVKSIGGTSTLPPDFAANFDVLLRSWSPPRTGSAFERYLAPLSTDKRYMTDVLAGLDAILRHLVWTAGKHETDKTGDSWFHGACLCTMAGLGLTALRALAERLASHQAYWAMIAAMTDEDLVKEIDAAHFTTGYPVGILRVDFCELQGLLFVHRNLGHPPPWYIASAALHVMKYCRRLPVEDDQKRIRVCYRGTNIITSVSDNGWQSPLRSQNNRTIFTDLKRALHFPFGDGKVIAWDEEGVNRLAGQLSPSMLPAAHRLEEQVRYLSATHTVAQSVPDEDSMIRPGIAIRQIAEIDTANGNVNKDSAATGSDVITYAWPHTASYDLGDLAAWQRCLPSHVNPNLPGKSLIASFKNINDLGEPEGLEAILNAIIVANIFRVDLRGTMLGAFLDSEHPLVTVLPSESTREGTTWNGKTQFGVTLGSTIAGRKVTHLCVQRQASAPSMRSSLLPLARDGIMVIDEWIMPTNPEHILSRNNLQTLATGGSVTPGSAGANAWPLAVRYNLIFTSKFCSDPPDVSNRTIPYVFMDLLSDKTRCTSEELAELVNTLASRLRLELAMYIQQKPLLDTVRAIMPVTSTSCRYPAHLALAYHFSQDPSSVDRYINAALKRVDQQYKAAKISGLLDDLDVVPRFDPQYYIDSLKPGTAEALFVTAEKGKEGCIKLHDAFTIIVENLGEREKATVLQQVKRSEAAAMRELFDHIAKMPIEYKDKMLVAVPISHSPIITVGGKGMPCLQVIPKPPDPPVW